MKSRRKIILYLCLCIWTTCAADVRAEIRDATPEELDVLNVEIQHLESIAAMDGSSLEALAMNTNAPYEDRSAAIDILAKDPSTHVDALERLIADPRLPSLRYAAIEAIEPARPDLAIQAIHVLLQEVSQIPMEQSSIDISIAIRASGLLARLGDGSGFPFVVNQLLHSPRTGDQRSAIGALDSFFYMKELKPYVPLVEYIDLTLSQLANIDEKNRGKTERLLCSAIYSLYGLHAVETIPEFHRWLGDPRSAPVRAALEANLRWLEALKAELDQGQPDKRDALKIVPGVDPAWKLPKAVRD